MDRIDDLFESAVRDGRIHGVSVQARDLKGSVKVDRSYGVSSVKAPEGERPPMRSDVLMRCASASKFLTSVMVLQCVEKGKLGLDDTLDALLLEVANMKVITGFDERAGGKPIEREPAQPVTVRHLLSHSSGISYAITHPLLRRFRRDQDVHIEQEYDTLDENFLYPLVYDPGTAWMYGPGLDWSSRLIARASGLTAEAYLQKYMVEPLGISADEMTFDILDHPGAHSRHADVVVRVGDSTSKEFRHDDSVSYWDRRKEASGGQGIFCSTRAYQEVLSSILADDGRLLGSAGRAFLFENALSEQAEASLNEYFEEMAAFHIGEPIPPEVKKTHSVGGLLLKEDCDAKDPTSWRRKGSLTWAGVTNFQWCIDPLAGVCFTWAFHLKPFGDPTCVQLGAEFERLVYDMARK